MSQFRFAILLLAAASSIANIRSAKGQPNPRKPDDSGRIASRINWRDYPEVSPFQGVRWRTSTAEVLVDKTWYELRSIDDLSAQRIVQQCRSLDEKDWQKRFEEDLAAVLSQMGWKVKDDVNLTVRRLDSGKTETLQHVRLTKENRTAIWQARNSRGKESPAEPTKIGAVESKAVDESPRWQNFARRSPFEAVRWNQELPEVYVRGSWYEFVGINDVLRAPIIRTCKQLDDDDWQKRFEEDLVEILARMGHSPVETVSLALKDLQTKQLATFGDVPMTEHNRDLLRQARFDREQSEKNAVLTRSEAEEDIHALQQALETQYSYRTLRHCDYEAELSKLRAKLSERNHQEMLKVEFAKILARFGDGHSGIADLDAALPPQYLPFLIDETQDGLVAFREDRTGFLVEGYPFVKNIDGLAVSKWLDAARPMVAAESSQYIRHASIKFLRYVGFLRQELQLPSGPTVHVELSAADGKRTTTVDLPCAAKKPLYGEWPRAVNHIMTPENLGYLRIGSMEDDSAFVASLQTAMNDFHNTRGLIIDVRRNGGGLRDGLRTLFPYFMRPDDQARVVNVAAFRINVNDTPKNKDGYLSDRYLYPLTASVWSKKELGALELFARNFKPEWRPPTDQFSDWHYSVIRPSSDESIYYSRPVVILMDVNCFSATDIFLGAFKRWRNVTLVGSPSGGGSGRPREVKLPHGSIHVKLSTMASFQPNGDLYDGHGIAPDITVYPVATDFIGQTDTVLEAAISSIRQ